MKKIKLKRQCAGRYTTKVNGLEVEIYQRQMEGRAWQLTTGEFGEEGYMLETFSTLREAKEALERYAEQGRV